MSKNFRYFSLIMMVIFFISIGALGAADVNSSDSLQAVSDSSVIGINQTVTNDAVLNSADNNILSSNNTVTNVSEESVKYYESNNETFSVDIINESSNHVIPGSSGADATGNLKIVNNSTVNISDNNSKINTVIYGDNLTMYHKDGSYFKFHLTDSDGKPLVNETVYFRVWNAVYELRTDSDGMASISIGLNPTNVVVSYYYLGNDVYGASNGTARIIVNKRTYKVDISDFTENWKEGKFFTVTVRDNLGNIVKNQNVTFSIIGVNYTRATDDNGVAKLQINLYPGTYSINTTIDSSKIYNGFKSTNTVRVVDNTSSTVISGENLTMYYSDGSRFKFYLRDSEGNPIVNETVYFRVWNAVYELRTDSDGMASISIGLNPANVTVSYYFQGNSRYKSSSNTARIVVNKRYFVVNNNVTLTENKNLSLTVKDNLGNLIRNQLVNFTIGSISFENYTDENGTVMFPVNNLSLGVYNAVTLINGNKTYNEFNENSTVIIVKNSSSTSVFGENLTMHYSDGSRFKFYLRDAYGNPIANETVYFRVWNAVYELRTDSDGMASIKIGLNPGSVVVSYYYLGKEGEYDASNGTAGITVNKRYYVVDSGNFSENWGAGKNFTVTVKDNLGNTISNQSVIFSIVGQNYTRTTDDNGRASLRINLRYGNYSIKTIINGNKQYTGFNKENQVNIIKNSTKITVNTGNIYLPGDKFTVTVKDEFGKVLGNREIVFVLNNKTYNATTNSNGVASINIPADMKTGSYNISYSYTDRENSRLSSSNTKAISIVENHTTIKGNDLKTTNNSNVKYNVTLLDAYGKAIANQNVSFTLNNRTYYATTNSNGQAGISINLKVGNYTVSYSFAGNSKYPSSNGKSKITVNKEEEGFTIAQIVKAAKTVKSYYDENGELPSTVTINNKKVTLAQFLYYECKAISQINSGNSSVIPYVKSLSEPSNPQGDSISGKLSKSGYVDSADRTWKFILEYNQGPNYSTTTLGKVSYDDLIYMFSNVLDSYDDKDTLPSTVSVDTSSSSDISKLAKRITSGLTTEYDKAEALFNWVRDNIAYSYYYNSQQGAQLTLTKRSGNCCDQSNLYVAMARSVGLTIRYVHGRCTFSDGTFGHVWTEVYVNGKWYEADCVSTRNSFGVTRNWNHDTAVIFNRYTNLPF